MNHWPFIAGAYAVAIVGTLLLVLASYRAMRRAEREAETVKRGR
ncbi:MAG: heme exporter protein CcmD [Sphingomonadaceae bacterium]